MEVERSQTLEHVSAEAVAAASDTIAIKDEAYAALTTEDDCVSVAMDLAESSNDADQGAGTCTEEEREKIHRVNAGRRERIERRDRVKAEQAEEAERATAMKKAVTSTSMRFKGSTNIKNPRIRQSESSEEEIKPQWLNDKPLNRKALKRLRYKERCDARQNEEAPMDVKPRIINDTTVFHPSTTPIDSLPPNIPTAIPPAITGPTHPQRPIRKDFKIIDGQAIPISEWRRARNARRKARKADQRERSFRQRQQQQQQHMEIDPPSSSRSRASSSSPDTTAAIILDKDNRTAAAAAAKTTIEGGIRVPTSPKKNKKKNKKKKQRDDSNPLLPGLTTLAEDWKAQDRHRHSRKVDCKRARKERKRGAKARRRAEISAEREQDDTRASAEEAHQQMRGAAGKRKAVVEAEGSKAPAGGGKGKKRKMVDVENGGQEGKGSRDLKWEVEGLGFKRLRIWEGGGEEGKDGDGDLEGEVEGLRFKRMRIWEG